MINKKLKKRKIIRKSFPVEPTDKYYKYILAHFGPREKKVLKHKNVRSLRDFLSLKKTDLKELYICESTLDRISKVQKATNNIIKSKSAELNLLSKSEFLHDLKIILSRIEQDAKQEEEVIFEANRITNYLSTLDLNPPKWSLLHKTIPDILEIGNDYIDILWSKSEDISIKEIGLEKDEFARLEYYAIYDDDFLSILLAPSLDYMQRLKLSKQSYDTIINFIRKLSNSDNMVLPINNIFNESIILTIKEIESIKNFRIDSFNIPDELISTIRPLNAITWGELARFSEKYLVDSIGLNWDSISIISSLWKMRVYALKENFSLSVPIPDFYKSFSGMINSFVKKVMDSCELERELELTEVILKGRFGLLDNKVWTLEELSKRTRLTRERVRQRFNCAIDKHRNLLKIFYMFIKEELRLSGGVCALEDLANSVALKMDWTDKVDLKLFSSVLLTYDDFKLDTDTGLVFDSICKCLKCERPLSYLRTCIIQEAKELSILEFIELLQDNCKNNHLCIKHSIPKFSQSFIVFNIEMTEDILIEDGFILREGAWGARKGSRVQMVEEVLKLSQRAMHFNEVYLHLKKSRPLDINISERMVYNWLTNNDNILLWGRGTFIHKDFVKFSNTLMNRISAWIESKLKKSGLPFISVSTAISKFKDELIESAIESDYALYSCLKLSDNNNLSYPRCPRVILRDAELFPVGIALEQFVLEEGGLMSINDVIHFGSEDLGMNHIAQRIQNIPNVIFTGRGMLIHKNNLPLIKNKIDGLFSFIMQKINITGHISVEKIFNDKKITCISLGIDSPEMLYAILQTIPASIKLPRFPLIIKSDIVEDIQGVKNLIDEWIGRLKRPCSFEELEHHFVENLGYKIGLVYNLTTKNKVIRYSRGSVIHLDTLDWNPEKQTQLNEIATIMYENACNAGRIYAHISRIIEEPDLPILANGVSYTSVLLAELLKNGDNFIVLGSAQNAFLCINNSLGISTLEDLFYEILKNNYDGATPLDQFVSDMRSEGLILKSITPLMLGTQNKVIIMDSIIMLKELSAEYA